MLKAVWGCGPGFSDQIEQEVGGDATGAAMFGLAHGTVLFAPTENALDDCPARLRPARSKFDCYRPKKIARCSRLDTISMPLLYQGDLKSK